MPPIGELKIAKVLETSFDDITEWLQQGKFRCLSEEVGSDDYPSKDYHLFVFEKTNAGTSEKHIYRICKKNVKAPDLKPYTPDDHEEDIPF